MHTKLLLFHFEFKCFYVYLVVLVCPFDHFWIYNYFLFLFGKRNSEFDLNKFKYSEMHNNKPEWIVNRHECHSIGDWSLSRLFVCFFLSSVRPILQHWITFVLQWMAQRDAHTRSADSKLQIAFIEMAFRCNVFQCSITLFLHSKNIFYEIEFRCKMTFSRFSGPFHLFLPFFRDRGENVCFFLLSVKFNNKLYNGFVKDKVFCLDYSTRKCLRNIQHRIAKMQINFDIISWEGKTRMQSEPYTVTHTLCDNFSLVGTQLYPSAN